MTMKMIGGWSHRSFIGSATCSSSLQLQCALTKQGERFLYSVATVTGGDTAAQHRLIRKFVTSSPKSVALSTLSHLLSPNSSSGSLCALALPMYTKISEESWFNWNPKLVAELIALLENLEQFNESEALLNDAVFQKGLKERELALFYSNLINFQSKHKSVRGVLNTSAWLRDLVSSSKSIYVKKCAYEAMVSATCAMDIPLEGQILIEEMMAKGLKPSAYMFKSVIFACGRLGLFEDMERNVILMEKEGFEVDTVCSNMILLSYGAHRMHEEMVSWLQRMKSLHVNFSIRTYNSVLSSCSNIMSLVEEGGEDLPLSIEDLMESVKADEGLLVQELLESSVLFEVLEWSSLEGKLDLHGLHLGSAYLIMLQWMKEMRLRLCAKNNSVPSEIVVVCGLGKHSHVRGESPVKRLVREMVLRTKSPLRIDRRNVGCFIAKGKAVRSWLSR